MFNKNDVLIQPQTFSINLHFSFGAKQSENLLKNTFFGAKRQFPNLLFFNSTIRESTFSYA